jgi:UDP-N-acetylglucosamine--N-acetylmuramyl-(pentapeptide) pyrophosphoryl-undecaprenol N-acetylglucosamine transferase
MTGVTRHYVLAAGGTGGHLIPAFALASELDRRGHHVALITDQRGAAIPGRPTALTSHVLPAGRIGGLNPLGWLRGLRAIGEGRRMALRLFESFEPSAVIGFGGYPALPALLAATSAHIPTIIHEQNAVLGRVNRLLASGSMRSPPPTTKLADLLQNTAARSMSSATRCALKSWRCANSRFRHSPWKACYASW